MKRLFLAVLLFAFILCLSSCSPNAGNARKLQDLDFTVIDPEEAPEPLTQAILKRHTRPFKLTYAEGNALYIARGYGSQPTGGYSITVDDVYQTANGLFFHTTLYGPRQDSVVSRVTSYPLIIVKVQRVEGCVIFN